MVSLLLFALLQVQHLGQPGGDWQELHRLHGQALGERYGYSIAWIGDINADDREEWVVGAHLATCPSGIFQGRVDVIDGATAAVLWTHIGNDDVRLGERVAAAGDMNGDGVPDYLVSQRGSIIEAGRVFAFSGQSGALIREFVSPIPVSGPSDFGARGMVGGNDVTADGVPDVFVGDSYFSYPGLNESRGKVYCFDGATGVLQWEIVGATPYDYYGLTLVLPGDLDGDGSEDLLVSSALVPYYGTIHVLNAHTGVEQWSLTGPRPFANIGQSGGPFPMASTGDVDGDGLPDFAFVINSASSPDGPPSVMAVKGSSGTLIWEWFGTEWDDDFGASIAGSDDLDSDGFPEILIGQPNYKVSGFDRPGAANLYSCRDGRLLRKFIGGVGRNALLGQSLAAGGDANGDGRPDLLLVDHAHDPTGVVSVVSYDPFLAADARVISAAAGAVVTFTLDFPVSEAGLAYRLLASNAEAGERSVGGVAVPLLETALMHRFVHHPPAVFSGLTGMLDAQGDVQVILTLPAGAAAAWSGQSLKFAAISELAPGQPSQSSGPVFLDLVP